MRPVLTEQHLENGEHGNWTLTDEDTGDILWQEWGPDTLGYIKYDFVNKTEEYIENPNRFRRTEESAKDGDSGGYGAETGRE